MKISCTVLSFNPGDDPENYRLARAVRDAVFVAEQRITVDEDWDTVDPGCLHFLAVSSGGARQALASARLGEVAQGCQTRPVAKIEWMGVLPEYRNRGVGKAILKAVLAYVRQQGYDSAYLQANTSAVRFYEAFGFETEGFAFEEGGYTYYAMRCMI